ncbi:MAG: glycosyltransferase family 4 protein [bacterium]
MVFVVMIVVFALSCGLTWLFLRPGSRFHVLDHPNQRSLHEQPTPRSGGIAFLIGLIAGWSMLLLLLGQSGPWLWMLAGAVAMGCVGWLDDRHDLSARSRFLVQFVVAASVLLAGWGELPITLPTTNLIVGGWLFQGLLLIAIVWMINLYNFMDGMDGNAGGMAVIGFGGYCLLGWLAGDMVFAGLNAVIVAAAAGFLVWNFPPARIFMGDSGSLVLGFLAAAMACWGVHEQLFTIWAPLLLFSPFIVDASFTLLRRLLRGEKVWEAHREHLYQRLVQLGWGHRKTVLTMYLLMLGALISAIISVPMNKFAHWLLVLGWALTYMALIAGVFYLERKSRHISG